MQKISVSFIILAAGIGSRMQSANPKVLHEVANRSLIKHLLDKIFKLKTEIELNKIIIVLGHEFNLVKRIIQFTYPEIIFVKQKKQLGTADAVLSVKKYTKGDFGKTIILCGDAPLISSNLLKKLINNSNSCDIGVVGFKTENPFGYGRIIKGKLDFIEKIVEQNEANLVEKKIKLCNSGILIGNTSFLMNLVANIGYNKNKKEKYLTDIVQIARSKNKVVKLFVGNETECIGVNTREDLAMVENEIQKDLRKKAMKKGVTLISPETVFFSYDTKVSKDVIIGPNVVFGPKVKIEADVTIEAFCHLEGVTIKKGAKIGPFARLRPGTLIQENAKIGNFVEVKKSVIKKGSKVNHLSYIGDSEVGVDTNVGAGVITCNYDGVNKNKTIIKEKAFIGSNASLVAPVKIGRGSIVGAGSVITKDIPDKTLAVERNKQVNIKKRLKKN